MPLILAHTSTLMLKRTPSGKLWMLADTKAFNFTSTLICLAITLITNSKNIWRSSLDRSHGWKLPRLQSPCCPPKTLIFNFKKPRQHYCFVMLCFWQTIYYLPLYIDLWYTSFFLLNSNLPINIYYFYESNSFTGIVFS